MTEREYIDATDLAKVRVMQQVLWKIVPGNSKITKAELGEVNRLLERWEKKLSVKIDPEP